MACCVRLWQQYNSGFCELYGEVVWILKRCIYYKKGQNIIRGKFSFLELGYCNIVDIICNEVFSISVIITVTLLYNHILQIQNSTVNNIMRCIYLLQTLRSIFINNEAPYLYYFKCNIYKHFASTI